MKKDIVRMLAHGKELESIDVLLDKLSLEDLAKLKSSVDRKIKMSEKVTSIKSSNKNVIVKVVTDMLGHQRTYRFILDENHNLYGVNERGEFCIGKYSDDLRVCFADIRWDHGGYDSLAYGYPYFYNGMIDADNHMLLAKPVREVITNNSNVGLNDLLGFDVNLDVRKEIVSNDDGSIDRLVFAAYSNLNTDQKRIVSEIKDICSASENLKDTVTQFIKR